MLKTEPPATEPQPPADPPVLIPLRRVARSLDLDPSTIAKMEARGDFVKSIDLGIRKKVYLYEDLQAWWKTRLGGIDGRPFPLAPETDSE